MKVYFDVNNGECIKPRNNIPPSYRATYKWMRLVKIEASWDRKILRGKLHKDPKEVHKIEDELAADFTDVKLLKKTMKRLAWRELLV